MKTLSAWAALAAACLSATWPAHAADDPIPESVLTAGPWQFGLHGSARGMPVGLAFKQGVTAGVITFKPGGKVEMDMPCRDEEFLQGAGAVAHMEGTWELKPGNALAITMMMRGGALPVGSFTTVHTVSHVGDELVLSSEGGRPKRLGRFHANLQDECKYE